MYYLFVVVGYELEKDAIRFEVDAEEILKYYDDLPYCL